MITASARTDAQSLPDVPWERIERFVGQLTHDVRNGLNALELQLTFLGEIATEPETAAEVKVIRKTVAEITRQLQTLRAATGAFSPNVMAYPAKDFFEDLRERFERREPDFKARLEWRVDAGESLLAVDPEMAMSALLELIANALQFADPEGIIQFVAAVTFDAVKISLQEPLAEAPPSALATWGFAPLLSTRRGAYGLGLFRARRIVEAQGGTLGAAYSIADKSLTTTVTLPISRLP